MSNRNYRKYAVVAILALFIAILAVAIAEQGISTTINNNFTAGNNWTIESNFTNLHPGLRTYGITYWNNQSKPVILDFNYLNNTNAIVVNITLLINGTIVSKDMVQVATVRRSSRIYYFIPQNSSYRIENTTSGYAPNTTWFEHNLTFSPNVVNQYITQGGGGGGVSFDGNVVNLNGSRLDNGTFNGTMNHANLTNLEWSRANHSIDAPLNMSGYNITNSPIVELKFNSTGGNLTGGFTEVRNNHVIGTFGARDVDINKQSNFFMLLNRVFNESAVTFDNGTHMDRFGAALGLSAYSNQITMAFNYLPRNLSGIPNQVNMWLITLSTDSSGYLSSGSMSLPLSNMTLKVTNLSGVGVRPACIAADGTLVVCP